MLALEPPRQCGQQAWPGTKPCSQLPLPLPTPQHSPTRLTLLTLAVLCSFLDSAADAARAALVCKTWARHLLEDALWQRFCWEEFGLTTPCVPGSTQALPSFRSAS